jgi:hypothetical protein
MLQPSILAIVLSHVALIVLIPLLSCPLVIVLMLPAAIVPIPIVETHPVVLLSPQLLLVLYGHYCIVTILSLLRTALDWTST